MSYPGYRYAILRTSFPELIKNHLIYLNVEMTALGGKYNASKYIATYPNGSMGFYMQCETEEQARNALGVEMMEAVFDEAPTFNWDHIMMICSSVRVPKDSGLTPLKRFNGNPIGPCMDEIERYFIDKEVDGEEARDYRPEEWRSIYVDMSDNVSLDVEAYRRQLSVGLSPHLRMAWLEGRRPRERALFDIRAVVDEGVRLTLSGKDRPEPLADTRLDTPYQIIEELPQAQGPDGTPASVLELPWVRIQGSYDDGYIDPAVMLWAVNVGPQVIVFNERVWTHTNSPDIAKDILDASVILREDGGPYQLPLSTIYADPVVAKQTTAVQSTQEVMQSVWRCLEHPQDTIRLKRCCAKARNLTFEASTNSRELYVSAINRLLQTEIAPGVPKLLFLRPDPKTDAGRNLLMRGIVGCPYLLKYLPKMQFDEKDPRKMADHKHDHAVVALAYLAASYPVQTTPRVEVVRPPWWSDFFIGNTNIPKQQYQPRRRTR
ncbi:MAG: hypothetical protein A3E01_06065 [Gammaproteobacteria bacterium RIFCSPHIGHO2_12_FULL_63_22]|nr:MAG: hypothetical protein A3E01_06065 [Gammaproteobacteria bacterium RIFCSPHIGHO2_12_FULL_63_22]